MVFFLKLKVGWVNTSIVKSDDQKWLFLHDGFDGRWLGWLNCLGIGSNGICLATINTLVFILL